MGQVRINDAALSEILADPGVQAKLRRVADRVADTARTTAARHVGNASYLGSIRIEQHGRGWRVLSDDEQAAIVEYGTRPHTITAGPGKVLWWPGAPHPVKTVHHPGSPAYHVFGNAADAARGD